MIERNVHHQDKRPSRTCAAAPEFNKHNGKWAAAFQTWSTFDETEYMAFSCTSAALFATPEEANEAAARALDVLQETGKYPNMCELF